MNQLTPEEITQFLNSPCQIWNDSRAWKEWLCDVLVTLVREEENFSGKRPNCDSGWGWQLAAGLSLVVPEIVLSRDDEGFPNDINWTLSNTVFEQVCSYVFLRDNG